MAYRTLDIHLRRPDGYPVRCLHTDFRIFFGVDTFRVDMNLLYRKVISHHRLAHFTPVRLHLDGSGILFLHLLHLCIKCRLLLFRQLRVKECRLQNGRVKGKVLLSHGAEEPLAEVGHHVPQAVDHGLHMLHLPVFPKALLLKTLYFLLKSRKL